MTHPVNFVFDLDGTLSDPLVGIHRCMNYALTWAGLDAVPQSRVAKLVGPPLDDGMRALVPEADDAQIVRLVGKYRERYSELGYAENTLYDGVADTLAELSRRQVSMGVCTSKRGDFAERILARFGIRAHFRFVDGGDMGIAKADQLRRLRDAGLVDDRSTMIGDRAFDIHAAHANRLSSVGVLWGYGSRVELEGAGAGLIISTVEELLRIRL